MKLFCTYGKIQNIVVKKSVKMRGQAFIVYENIEDATKALYALQGHILYYKSMVIKYAKFKSDIIAQREGIFEEEKKKRELDRGKFYDKRNRMGD